MGNTESREQTKSASNKSNSNEIVPPVVQKFVDLAEKLTNDDNILTYYFKSSREITKEESKLLDFKPKVKHLDMVSFTSTGKIGTQFWHVAVFRNGSREHHEKEIILPDKTKVIVTVADCPAVQFLYSISSAKDEAKELLEMLPDLNPEQVEKLECVVKMFIVDGKIAVDKRAGVVQHIIEKLKEQGVGIATKILPLLGLDFFDNFLNLSENEQHQYYEILFTTIASVGVSLSNVAQSIEHVLNAEKKFKEEVLKWFGPVLKCLENILMSTQAAIACMEEFKTSNSEQALADTYVVIGDISYYVQDLLKKLPAIQKKAQLYAEEMDKVRANERDKVLASFITGIAEGGFAAAELWNTGWKALNNVQKATVIAGFLRAGACAAEFGASAYAYLVIDSYMERTKQHLQFYDETKQVLDAYDITLKRALDREEKHTVIYLLEQFKNHEKHLSELLEKGKKLKHY